LSADPITAAQLLELMELMRRHQFAVEVSVGVGDAPQAALVGIAVTDAFELVFDTLETTRKVANLRRNPRIAFVIGGWVNGDERTVQFEGIADEPRGDELARIKAAYFARWPDGRSRELSPGLAYIRVRPTWVRYSDFNQNPPAIVEFDGAQLGATVVHTGTRIDRPDGRVNG
jgi:general stress protein 26